MEYHEKKITTVLLTGAVGVGLIGGANASTAIELELPAEKKQSSFIYEPVPHKLRSPGEFRDVDLPDELKKEKQIYLSENITRPESSRLNSITSKKYSIQVAMFKNRFNAERYEKKLLEQHLRVYLLEKKNKLHEPRYYIRIGHYQSRQQAETVLKDFVARSGMQAFIVSD